MPAEPEPAVWGVAGSTNLRSKRSDTAKRKRSKPDYLNTQHATRPAAKKLKCPAATRVSSEDKADQADQAWQQKPGLHDHSGLTGPATSYSCPDSAWHGDTSPSYHEYRSRLTADLRHRCVRVSENARGAQCLAIATGKKSRSGVLIQVKECACLAAALFQSGLALIVLKATCVHLFSELQWHLYMHFGCRTRCLSTSCVYQWSLPQRMQIHPGILYLCALAVTWPVQWRASSVGARPI